ncbi:MAG: hypothetical protein EP343_19925 [Deltaproteobacteria bacterium]|nr:MAG: hypothetical protein EP343_19925 [Deltaproteobacteria bacterium]
MLRLGIKLFVLFVVGAILFVGCGEAPKDPCSAVTCPTGQTCKEGTCVGETQTCTDGQTRCGTTCHNTKTDSTHCGSCNNKCREGEACKEGQCVLTCEGGKQACGPICVDTQTDVQHCGACGTSCKPGEVCKDGACKLFCASGTTACGDTCVDTSSNTKHCGACNNPCKDKEICKEGQCTQVCESGKTDCSGNCVDTQTDNNNCGACGKACKSKEICKAGTCELDCNKDQTACGDACVDTQTDDKHCGSCDNACPSGDVCKAGTCELDCPQGQVDCNGQCADTTSDVKHCGGCGKGCLAGEVCSSGACQSTCQSNETFCSGSCVNLQASTAHCGSCGNACKPGENCNAGKCTVLCQSHETKCSGVCAYLKTDSKHCGACGNACKTGEGCCGGTCIGQQDDNNNCGACGNICSGGSSCVAGACTCPKGQTLCSGTCVDLQSSKNNCGACGTSCTSTQACVQGSCLQGWAVSAGGYKGGETAYERSYAIAKDSNGNIYVSGNLNAQLKLGSLTLAPPSGKGLFVAKFDNKLQVQWAKVIEGDRIESWGLDVDSGGNVYVAGSFESSSISMGTLMLKKSGQSVFRSDAFVAKLDGNGKWLWVNGSQGAGSEWFFGVKADTQGNVYVAGSFADAKTSSPVRFGLTALTSDTATTVVGKLDSKGKWLWAQQITAKRYSNRAYGIDLDSSGSPYITGYMWDSTIFGSTTLYANRASAFVAKLDTSGQWQWAVSATSQKTESSYSHHIATDSSGNSYIVGYFYEKAVFGSLTMTSKGSTDVFVAKVDNKGKWLWAAQGGGSNKDEGYGIDIDASGNVFVTGYFDNAATFGSLSVQSKGRFDSFVAQLDSKGKWKWATAFGGNGNKYIPGDSGRGVVVDSAGKVYVSGTFAATVGFGSSTFTSQGHMDIFVTQLDSKGAIQNTKAFGGTVSGFEILNAVTVDSTGNIYVMGSFDSTLSIGTTTLSSPNGNQSMFVGKLDPKGKWLWVRSVDVSSGSLEGRALALDSSSHLYIVGAFSTVNSSSPIQIGATSLVSKVMDVFVAKMDKDGTWLWAKTAGGSHSDYGETVEVDSTGNVYVGGYFSSKDAGFGSTTLSSQGNSNAFVAKMDASGKWLWAKSVAGNYSQMYGLHLDSQGNIYTTGLSSGTANFGSLTHTGSGTSNDSLFVAKLDKSGAWKWVSGAKGARSFSRSIRLDKAGNIYVTGNFNDTVTLGSDTLSSSGNQDMFVGKLDNAGKWLWARKAGGPGFDSSNKVDVDAQGHVYFTGMYSNKATFGSTSFTASGFNLFLAHLDTNGKWVRTREVPSTSSSTIGSIGYGIKVGDSGIAYVVGVFSDSANFGGTTLKSNGSNDMFVWFSLP